MAVEPITPRSERKVWKAGDLARRIRTLLETEIGWVWIEGECSNVRPAASGHVYFTLKDEAGQIQAALFRGDALAAKVRPRDGLKVRVYGQVTAYEKSSQYQVIVRKVEEAGAGDLHAAFEKLKARLLAEGLFSAARKRPLPVLPAVIGIVTSPQGAALRDMLTVLGRRFPNRRILIAPCRVQGAGSATEIADAIRLLNEDGRAEVIIVGRGGGSIEDLWAFNEEEVARAIAASAAPVISAVGHETDFTIADFAADVRAPTPSAAAELVIRPRAEWFGELSHWRQRLARTLRNAVQERRSAWRRAAGSPALRDPSALVAAHRDRLAQMRARAASSLLHAGAGAKRRLESGRLTLEYRLRSRLATEHRRLDDESGAAERHLRSRVTRDRAALGQKAAQIRALDPTAILGRGFSITLDETGRILRAAGQTAPGGILRTKLASGEISSTVNRVIQESPHES